ncbi:MAG TPA: mechanosensitive ion channel family protein [Burkholderiales bacterium]|jgi:small-conductance mechanosensitive channel/CRP-like cAMP-binding protein
MLDSALAYAWRPESLYVLAIAVVLALAAWRFGGPDHAPVYRTALLFIVATLGQFVAGLLSSAGFELGARFLFELSLLTAGVTLIRLFGILVFRAMLPLLRIPLLRIVEDIAIFLAYVAWLLVRLRTTGFDPSSLLASTAVVTAVVAFAMQDTLGNILGGLAIQLDDSIHVGDWVRVDEISGKVADIRWRYTAIETRNWETVIVPNSELMKRKFSVLARRQEGPPQWRRHVLFNVDLAAPPTRVIPAIEKAIREAEIANVAAAPQPNCVLMGFEHGYGQYDMRYWLTDPQQDDPTDSQVRVHIYAALQRAGLRLAVEERDIRLTEQTEEHRHQVQEREISRRISALRVVDLFNTLTPDEQRTVAERLAYMPYAQGEVVTRQGNVAHGLYILTGGEVDILIDLDSHRQCIATLGAGTFFGEMGMLTGAPRSATVVAKSNVECYRLDKSHFEMVIRSRPTLVDEISRVMASRQTDLQAAVSKALNEDAALHAHGELFNRICGFFGISTGGK